MQRTRTAPRLLRASGVSCPLGIAAMAVTGAARMPVIRGCIDIDGGAQINVAGSFQIAATIAINTRAGPRAGTHWFAGKS